MEAGESLEPAKYRELLHEDRMSRGIDGNVFQTLTKAELKHTLICGGKSLVLPNRLLNNRKTPRREMMRLDADPGGSNRVWPIIYLFSNGMQHPSFMSSGEGPS